MSDQPCPVCAGAGHWERGTGSPIFTKPVPGDAVKCMYCGGTGKVMRIPRP